MKAERLAVGEWSEFAEGQQETVGTQLHFIWI